MGKRKLTLQQKRRISEKQRPKTPAPANLKTKNHDLGPEQEGIIITRFGKRADVLPPDFKPGDSPFRCHIRANIIDIVTGDKVIWCQGKSGSVIERTLPRDSTMSRPDNHGNLRPVAANVDRIAIVIAPEPTPYANLIDRYLVAATHQQIQPLLIINKIDLITTEDSAPAKLGAKYAQLGYDVFFLSASRGDGLQPLLNYLANHTTVLVGQSGVGKSALVNLLYPEAEVVTGALSQQLAKGRHTTTAATLYQLPTGGYLIDSPGIREFGLWHLDYRGIAEGFIEFQPFLGTCRFRDCQHNKEPDCAIIEAVSQNKITQVRLKSYQQIVSDMVMG